MPIRQNILRKGKAPKQNLLEFDVFQQETGVLGDLSTSRFFRISEFPPVLPTGNSSFLIEGSDLLKPNVELKTELLDSAGNPIFHYAIPNYDKELPARRITIEVYEDDVINGIGSFTVLGELDPRKFEVPTAFQNTYNVRFSAPISINKNIKNTQPIRFYGDPTISVSELVKGVIQPVYTGNQRTKTITGSVSLNVSTPSIAEYGADDSTTADSTKINEVGNNQAAYISQNVGEAQSSILGNSSVKSKPYSTYVVDAMEKGVDNELNKITSTMKGATFSITRPDLLVDATTYPDAKFTKPTTFSTKILDVLNSTTFTTTTQYKIRSKTNNQELVVPLNASASNSTITHNVGSVVRTASTVFQRSFANVTVGNLRTFSGDTYKAKIYAKEDGSSGEFEKIYETLVESPNELVDQNSNSGFKSVGIFATQSIVDNFWVSSSNTFTATQDDDTLIDGILLSGSTEPNANSFTFETSQSYSLEKNEPYLVDFNVAFKPQNKVQSDGTTKKDAKLEVFLTGTFLSETSQEVPLGEVDLGEYDFNEINTFTKVEKRQVSDFLTHNVEGGVATGSLGFRLHSGEFILSDVRLRPFSETNFSPGFFKANVPMPPAIKRGQPYDFVVEFYDANNSLAEAVAVADDVVFAGPRQVLGDGNDGVLTGSVFLSNTEDSGIEFHGGSAYIRSVGYNGFARARDEGTSGFLMFSGSVSKSLNTSESYDGVGIEIISGSKGSDSADKFLQFRTNDGDTPAVFKVQTDDFFLGGEGQFVSGSNGNIELSSSKLHITSDGQITGSEVLFSGGTITSDVNILGSVAANSILTPATIGGVTATPENASASIDDNGRAIFKSGSIGGFTLTDTELSASGLSLKSSGQITGSNVLLNGGVITSDVTIQGSVAANSILTPATIAGAAANVGNASSSIDDNGNAVFRSGSIGGFAFTGTVLTASKFELDTANEKLTLGSGNSVFIADSGDGIQLGHATFGSAPFRVNMDGELTATSVTISGNITATAGPVSSSLTALGIKTGSLEVASSSLSLASSSFEVSTSLAALTGSEQQDSLNAVGVVSESLLIASGSFRDSASLAALTGSALTIASESMQKQFVLVDDDTLNLQNAKGGILSSFSDYAKFFGSASNALVTSSDNGTVNYTEINDKGFLVVTGSSTASFFGNTTTIGDTSAQHISIAPDSLSIKTSNNVTVLSASADGIVMSGSISATSGKIAGWDIDGNKLESFNSSTKGIVLDADPSTPNITIQENSNNKIELFHTTATNFGLKGTIGGDVLFRLGSTNEIGGFSITENAISSSNNKLILRDNGLITASAVQITGEVNASSGTTATAISAIGVQTASILIQTGSLLSFTGSAETSFTSIGTATASLNEQSASFLAHSASMNQHSASVNAETGSINSSLGSIGTATASLNEQSASFLAHSASMNQHSESVNTTTGSLLTASSSMATQVKISSAGVDVQNEKGSTISRFSTSAKFFGSASLSNTYAEVSEDGLTIVSGSATSSFFGNEVLLGDTSGEHIKIDSDSIDIKTAANVTVLSASADGIEMSGSIKANGGTIGGMTIDDDSIFAGTKDTSGFASNNADITIGTDGIHTKTFFVNTDGTSGFKGTLTIGSTDLTAGNTLNTNTDLSDVGLSLSDISGSISGSFLADASSSLSAASKSMADQVILSSNAVTVQANADNKAALTTSGVEIFQGGNSVSNFGSTVRVGRIADDHSRVEIDSGALKIINRQGSTDTDMLIFKDDGDIESGDFLIERSRLFGAGGDGDIVLKSNDCTVSNGAGSAAKSSTSVIVDERGDQVCIRTGSVWEMKGDWYTKSLEIDDSVAATTLITSGSRLFVQGTLTIDSGCVIHNDGGDGDDGANAANSDNSTSGYGSGGANSPTKPGSGGPGNALAGGGDGAPGSRGGNPDTSGGGTAFGANGGAGGGNGGIIMIAARTITNNGTIRSHGGAGGDGGRGASGSPGGGGTAAADGQAGSAGSVVHVKI